jgi:bacteriocin-like protein
MGAISFHISGRYNMEEKKKINEEEMKKISGGYMLWGRTCKICGGVINNDPNTPYDIRCHCNEDSTQSWVPRPRQ